LPRLDLTTKLTKNAK